MNTKQSSHLCRIEMDERRKQIMEAGTQTFPITAWYNDLDLMPAQVVPWHWHPECELIYMVEGCVNVYIGDQQRSIKEGEGLWINSNYLHHVKKQAERCISYSFVFDARLIGGEQEGRIAQRYVLPLLEDIHLPYVHFRKEVEWQADCIDGLFQAFQAYEQGSFGYELTLRNHLSNLWILMAQHCIQPQKEKLPETLTFQRIKQMLHFIQEHYEESITLIEIASAASISEREALRCFQKVLHDSPIAYLAKYRIGKAAQMLEEEAISITEVAQACGFDDSGYFTKQFKRYMNMTPRTYRKQHQMVEL